MAGGWLAGWLVAGWLVAAGWLGSQTGGNRPGGGNRVVWEATGQVVVTGWFLAHYPLARLLNTGYRIQDTTCSIQDTRIQE